MKAIISFTCNFVKFISSVSQTFLLRAPPPPPPLPHPPSPPLFASLESYLLLAVQDLPADQKFLPRNSPQLLFTSPNSGVRTKSYLEPGAGICYHLNFFAPAPGIFTPHLLQHFGKKKTPAFLRGLLVTAFYLATSTTYLLRVCVASYASGKAVFRASVSIPRRSRCDTSRRRVPSARSPCVASPR